MVENSLETTLLPHHKQLDLCTSRLPYRQGRKFTAVKVYSLNNESKHLLVFGVPSLNLRQETKALFSKFGKLLQFNITKYPAEQFTETYHALFENIQSARVAKKMLDNKNYYGGLLHICYAPELEDIHDTQEKLLLRRNTVVSRLKNLHNTLLEVPKKSEENTDMEKSITISTWIAESSKLYMGTANNIQLGKRKATDTKTKTKFKKSRNIDSLTCDGKNPPIKSSSQNIPAISEKSDNTKSNIDKRESSCDIIDFTSADTEVLSNINESLNYNTFGKEIIRDVPYKPVNKITFNINKKSL